MHPCELPDHVVIVLLKREALLTRVKLHTIGVQQIIATECLRSLQTKQSQVLTSMLDHLTSCTVHISPSQQNAHGFELLPVALETCRRLAIDINQTLPNVICNGKES